MIQQTKAQALFMDWTLDVLIYVTILNIFVHYVDDFFVENFMYSLGTAVVLKATLTLVLRFEHQVREWFNRQKGTVYKVLKPLSLWAILFGSKFVILEIIDFIFGKKVDLHNIIALIFMIIIMIATRQAINTIYQKLGQQN